MTIFREKIKEVLASVLPVFVLMSLLQLFLRPFSALEFGRFTIGTLLILFGLALFLLGVDLSVSPIGKQLGKDLLRPKKVWILLGGAFVLGFIISMAEPDLLILADNIFNVTNGQIPVRNLVISVSLGLGLMVTMAFARQLKNFRLRYLFTFIYLFIAIMAVFSGGDFTALAFDASGATTGAITTPFLLALAAGLAARLHSRERDASGAFGMVGLSSSGAIIAVLLLGLWSSSRELTGGAFTAPEAEGLIHPFTSHLGTLFYEAFSAFWPLAAVYALSVLLSRELKGRRVSRIVIGMLYCLIGLTLFTAGVHGGFMNCGWLAGTFLVTEMPHWVLPVFGFLLGLLTILAEPAVHILTRSIEEQTAGFIPRKLVLLFLSLGVALSVLLSMLRILFKDLQLWHILLPGYLLAIILLQFSDELFAGIAFDSGGVASGPMCATFILAFAQGAASAFPNADIIRDGFGIIALVAMTPILSIEILGLLFRYKQRRQLKAEVADRAGKD